ncbi:hypothetical protein VV02_07355 [Luteipulveratus mongoliensis]|uniref:Uncharacterized protein n=2 Tax=Luteipulveratus mongoliensis TaxID=571913 RepID=A0A0K1JG90_9MICO|nr:hypothetical protein VV02_07355 [Luteipulveratus mongoliensis]
MVGSVIALTALGAHIGTAAADTRPAAVNPTVERPYVSTGTATAQLRAIAGHGTIAVVRIGNSFEGAIAQGDGRIAFYAHGPGTGDRWTLVNRSTAPDTVDTTAAPALSGNRPPGLRHAVFIATGEFTGDGTGQAIAYGSDGVRWSVLTHEANSGQLAPSGHGGQDQPGLSLMIAFTAHGLRTTDMWGPEADASFYLQKQMPVIADWAWGSGGITDPTHSKLQRSSDNTFTPKQVPTPHGADSVPTKGALPDGTYFIRKVSVFDSSVTFTTAIRTTGCVPDMDHDDCFANVGPQRTLNLAPSATYSVDGFLPPSEPNSPPRQLSITAPRRVMDFAFGPDAKSNLAELALPFSPWMVTPSWVFQTFSDGDIGAITVVNGRITQLGTVSY